jgi:hypothetical protein
MVFARCAGKRHGAVRGEPIIWHWLRDAETRERATFGGQRTSRRRRRWTPPGTKSSVLGCATRVSSSTGSAGRCSWRVIDLESFVLA